MSYFKNVYTNSPVDYMALFNDTDEIAIIRKHYDVPEVASASFTHTITPFANNMNYTITSTGGMAGDGMTRIMTTSFSDTINSGAFSTGYGSQSNVMNYGEGEFKDCDAFTFRDTTSNILRTIVDWNDGIYDYSFHVYDSSTNHYASVATNNPDIVATDVSFTFPVVKDFDIRTVANSLNGGSDKYIIQPLVAFGMKTPIFLITGANGADVPLFSEIEAQGKSYFVIGSNYCVEM